MVPSCGDRRWRAGNEFSRVTIDPNTVPLNPNRAPLYYSAILYRPPRNGRNLYVARIQVFGNYEQLASANDEDAGGNAAIS